MINITELIHILSHEATVRRSQPRPSELVPFNAVGVPPIPRPNVTWRITNSSHRERANKRFGLRARGSEAELSRAEGKALIGDLAAFGVPRLVLTGGEPLERADLPEWVAYARELQVETSLLTPATGLNAATALALKQAGLCSLSILVDRIRGELTTEGSSEMGPALAAYEYCAAAGLEAELRIALNRWNYAELAGLFEVIERRLIRRVVFDHLVYGEHGSRAQDDLTHEETRRALELICEFAAALSRRGAATEIATDENHADGIYLYLRLARRQPWRAAALARMLPAWSAELHGSGVGLAGIDSTGNVHPDPYWANYVLGNIREVPFSEIWGSPDPLLGALRDRGSRLKGRCAHCRWQPVCGGNLRVRAEQYFGDPWASDPACYLTQYETGKEASEPLAVMEDDVLSWEEAA